MSANAMKKHLPDIVPAHSLMARPYKHNITSVKILGHSDKLKIKVTTCGTVRSSGVEYDYSSDYTEKGSVNDEKLANNITRARTAIFELASCNPWEYFVTLTVDSKKYDRSDLDMIMKKLRKFVNYLNIKYGAKIDYLLIPETHADGENWHLHGLMRGLPKDTLKQFELGGIMGKYIAEKVKKGLVIYNWIPYAEKFGYCSVEPLRNEEAATKYITKYITEDLGRCVTKLGAHLYYHSQGLSKAALVKQGEMSELTDLYVEEATTFSNDYCTITTFPYSDEILNAILEHFELPADVSCDFIEDFSPYDSDGFMIICDDSEWEELVC